MTQAIYNSSYDDVEELRKRFEDFRGQHEKRTRLPEELWRAAAEIAERRGMNLVCRCLRLDANSSEEVDEQGRRSGEPTRSRQSKRTADGAPAAFHGTDRAGISGANELHVGSGSTSREGNCV